MLLGSGALFVDVERIPKINYKLSFVNTAQSIQKLHLLQYNNIFEENKICYHYMKRVEFKVVTM